MSITTAIDNVKQKILNAYMAISDKGGTLPDILNLDNLVDAINSIPSSSSDNSTT